MANNIERDLQLKSTYIKKKGIKDLQNLLGRIYTAAIKSNNNKLIYIKRDVDKLSTASNYLNNLDLPDPKEVRESTFNKEILSPFIRDYS